MVKKKSSLHQDYLKLMKATNLAQKPMFNRHSGEEIKTQIRPNKEVSPGKFKADPLHKGSYMAHPTTIKAMRKDLFVAGQELFIDLEDKVICSSCSSEIDRQFWLFCPFCEAKFNM